MGAAGPRQQPPRQQPPRQGRPQQAPVTASFQQPGHQATRPALTAQPAGDDGSAGTDDSSGRFRRIGLVTAGVLVVGLVAGGVVWATSSPTEPANPAGSQTTSTTTSVKPRLPADELCTSAIKANPRWVCLTKAAYEGDELVVEYTADWAGEEPNINGGFHLHVYGSDGTDPAADVMGSHAGSERGEWVVKDENPAVLTPDQITEAVGDNRKVCGRIAQGKHELVQDTEGGYATGNCVKITGRPQQGADEPAQPPAQQPNNPPPPVVTTTTTTTTTTEPTPPSSEPSTPALPEGG